jgi:hypothetical protein
MGQRVSERVERLARMIWSRCFDLFDKEQIAHRYGFTKDEIRWLDWASLPDVIKEHIRDMAQKDIESEEGS